ncbi:MAG: HEPN domain-containing protein, partial [Novosphingobium sp.]|nr:HEPN domain-containing protein [Novosphingobium sp.]
HCLPRAHAQQSSPALTPAGGKLGVTSRGITLRKTYAYLMQPAIMAFSPAPPGRHHPGPWKETRGGNGRTISTELFIPSAAAADKGDRIGLAHTIILLLRLWVHPGVELVVGSNMAFEDIPHAKEAAAILIQPPMRQRHFQLMPVSSEGIQDALPWTSDHFEAAQNLIETSSEFRLAANALDEGQFYQNTALAMVSLWGALEAIFSPNKGELRFRVSSLIAAYLYPPGSERLQNQRLIAKLYDKRSAAAHGKPLHTADDLLNTFELVRAVLIRFIREGHVPSREEFEANLFGAQ